MNKYSDRDGEDKLAKSGGCEYSARPGAKCGFRKLNTMEWFCVHVERYFRNWSLLFISTFRCTCCFASQENFLFLDHWQCYVRFSRV